MIPVTERIQAFRQARPQDRGRAEWRCRLPQEQIAMKCY